MYRTLIAAKHQNKQINPVLCVFRMKLLLYYINEVHDIVGNIGQRDKMFCSHLLYSVTFAAKKKKEKQKEKRKTECS